MQKKQSSMQQQKTESIEAETSSSITMIIQHQKMQQGPQHTPSMEEENAQLHLEDRSEKQTLEAVQEEQPYTVHTQQTHTEQQHTVPVHAQIAVQAEGQRDDDDDGSKNNAITAENSLSNNSPLHTFAASIAMAAEHENENENEKDNEQQTAASTPPALAAYNPQQQTDQPSAAITASAAVASVGPSSILGSFVGLKTGLAYIGAARPSDAKRSMSLQSWIPPRKRGVAGVHPDMDVDLMKFNQKYVALAKAKKFIGPAAAAAAAAASVVTAQQQQQPASAHPTLASSSAVDDSWMQNIPNTLAATSTLNMHFIHLAQQRLSTLENRLRMRTALCDERRLQLSNDALAPLGGQRMAALSPHGCLSHAVDLYHFTASMQASEDGILGIRVIIELRAECASWHESQDPISYFRVWAIGYAIAAADVPIILSPGIRSHTAFIPVPDAGIYCIEVRLMIYDTMKHMTIQNYQPNAFKDQQMYAGVLVDELIARKHSADHHQCMAVTKNPNADDVARAAMAPSMSLSFSQYALSSSPALPFSQSNASPLPLCGSSDHFMLAGRWVGWDLYAGAGPLPKTSLLGGAIRNAQWMPFKCSHPPFVKTSSEIVAVLDKYQWIYFIGDSVTRLFFVELCEMANGARFETSKSLGVSHTPIGCLGENFYLSYSPYWYPDYTMPLNEQWTFSDYCQRYHERDVSGIVNGWPHCHHANANIQSMSSPTLTYFSWGIHPAEVGREEFTHAFRSLVNHAYFHQHSTLFALTSAVSPSYIPRSFHRRWLIQNNERIQVWNDAMIAVIREAIYQNALPTRNHRAMHATAAAAAAGNANTTERRSIAHDNHPAAVSDCSLSSSCWLPVFDVFSASHAAYDLLNFDAVHFEYTFRRWTVGYFIHYLNHAPNFQW